jgi:hypothetical protein
MDMHAGFNATGAAGDSMAGNTKSFDYGALNQSTHSAQPTNPQSFNSNVGAQGPQFGGQGLQHAMPGAARTSMSANVNGENGRQGVQQLGVNMHGAAHSLIPRESC